MARGNYGDLDELAAANGFTPADGIALDLGVSSMQFDEAERGFSFAHDGPLDMRMGGAAQGGITAADIVNNDDVADLVRILKTYGEERRARTVALAIEAARKEKPITRTKQLADIIERAIGSRGKPDRIHPATRTFQALRIAVNDELGELERGLLAAEKTLAPNGRLAVVSFHSLEDRIVKQFLTERSGALPQGSRHMPEAPQGPAPTFELIIRGAEKPTDEEVAENPRARSARLRAARRTAAPAWANLRKAGGCS
jgi:16S rRNA (cytosine1402-N4)-methyltransferase